MHPAAEVVWLVGVTMVVLGCGLIALLLRVKAGLAASDDRLSALVESAMDGIVSIDEHQRLVHFNAAAEKMFGYKRDAVLGQDIGMLMPEAFRAAHKNHVREFGHSGATSRGVGSLGVVHGLRSDGSQFPLEASISQLTTGTGKLFTAVVRDVSQRIHAEEERDAFSARLGAIREEDKKRIARELHDGVAQELAALKMDTTFILSDPRLSDEARGRLVRMGVVLADSMIALRRIAAGMRPLVLDELGFGAALEVLGETFTQRTGVPCAVSVDDNLELQDPHATEIYRMAQEALNNIAKHAGATQVKVCVSRRGECVSMAVHDDGVGFVPGDVCNSGSLGLIGLRERVHLLRGTLRISSEAGRGTEIEVTLSAA